MKAEKLINLLRDCIREELIAFKSDLEIPPPEEKYLTRTEIMKMLNLSSTTVWKLCKSGELKFIRIGRKLYFLQKEIDLLLNQNTL